MVPFLFFKLILGKCRVLSAGLNLTVGCRIVGRLNRYPMSGLYSHPFVFIYIHIFNCDI